MGAAAIRVALLARSVLAASALVACHATDTNPTADAPDAQPGSAMLHLAWSAKPGSPPVDTGNNVTVATASFSFENLRVVGDAGPGDPRTLVDHVAPAWSEGHTPATIDFPTAPLGRYSRVVFELPGEGETGDAPSAQLAGTVRIDGDPPVAFSVTDASEATISLPVDVEVAVGVDTTIHVEIDIAKIVNGVDWKSLPLDGATRVLAPGDPQSAALSAQLAGAFAAR